MDLAAGGDDQTQADYCEFVANRHDVVSHPASVDALLKFNPRNTRAVYAFYGIPQNQ